MDMSVPPSPVCHSVEMDVYLGQSELSGPSFLSLPDSSSPVRDSPSSLLESKAFDSSILEFWAASGLAPQTDVAGQEEGVVAWASCDSLLNLPTKTTPSPDPCKASSALVPTRQLRRKKALMQLRLASPSSSDSPAALLAPLCTFPLSYEISHYSPAVPGQEALTLNTTNTIRVHRHSLTTFLTLSEEDLLMSIAAAAAATTDTANSNSDSGRDSPRTTSSFSNTRSTSCSSWSDQSEDKFQYGEIRKPEPQLCSSLCETGLYKYPSVDSVASTFLPSPSPDSTRSPSTTRIGVPRGKPSWLLPPWSLCVIYPLVAVLLGACLALVGLYGSFFSRAVVLMWLISFLSAFLTSALLLEPLNVCVQALIYTALWRPVDPEVEDQLAEETTVVRAFGEHSGKVRPPCGYGLLQAKEEARKVRALRSLMRHCVCQLLFLLLVLMVNYQDSIEQRQGRLLHAAVRNRLHTAPSGVPNLTSLKDWADAGEWINHTLVTHMHQNPLLHLVGLPQLQYTHTHGSVAGVFLGNSSVMTQRILVDLHLEDWRKKQFKTLSVDFTHYHRGSALFVCVSIQLKWAQTQRVTPSISIYPLLIPSSFSGLDLQVALTILLIISALLILLGELWSMAAERSTYLSQGQHWFQLLLVSLSLATSILQLRFLSQATSCISQLRSQPDRFINFHSLALLAQRSSQCAAVLLTLLVLKLLGTLRFVRRWVVIGRVLQRAWRELWALSVLLLLLLLLCTHLGNTLFSRSVEGFLSVGQAGVSVLSILRGRTALQRLCKVHPVLGPLYGLLLMGGGVWLLARLCGAVLIRAYRAEQADMYRPAIEPQDYEMVEFFIKRLKLWMGLTKAKEFRHRVKFEGIDMAPSRSSHESRLTTLSSTLPSSHSPSLSSSFSSPCLLSSSLSVRSEDSESEPGFDVQPYLDHLLPCVNALLSRFDRVNQITDDIQNLEMKLDEAQCRRRKMRISNSEKGAERCGESTKEVKGEGRVTGEVRHRRTGLLYPKPRVSLPSSFSFTPSTLHSSAASICIFPRTRSSYSESESVQHQSSSYTHPSEAAMPPSVGCGPSLYPAASPGCDRFRRRRAWHSGSSHSADATQRTFQSQGGTAPCGGENSVFAKARPRSEDGIRRRISEGVPVKRKAWISEEPETIQT